MQTSELLVCVEKHGLVLLAVLNESQEICDRSSCILRMFCGLSQSKTREVWFPGALEGLFKAG